MRSIRRNVFETNSSSTHTMTICMKSDYEKFKKGELVLSDDAWGFDVELDKQFYTKEEAIELYKNHYEYKKEDINWEDEDEVLEALRDAGLKDIDDENDYLESYYDEFTTPNGEEIVVFGEYGYEG